MPRKETGKIYRKETDLVSFFRYIGIIYIKGLLLLIIGHHARVPMNAYRRKHVRHF